ncbi:MAG: type VI secretion system protein TssA [Planctomycetota bacterium]|jgi:type VI secretion system protein ImpA
MSEFDVETLLSEVSAEAPCGEDLSYDQSFLALEALVRTGAGGAGVIDAEEEEAVEPNWREVDQKCFELLARSKDLRIALYLALAMLKLEGLAGLRDGLYLLHELLERYWDHVWPQLDPEDDLDPLERINIVQSLSPATVSEQDPMKFKQRVAEVTLCSSPQMGRFSLRDIQVAKGEVAASADEGGKTANMSVIDAAFQDTPMDQLEATCQAAAKAIEHVTGITTAFSKNAAQGQTPDLSGFQAVLGSIHKQLQGHLGTGGEAVGAGEPGAAGDAGETGSVSLSGQIRTSKEALMALDKVCQYFERHEPSSPVPLLLRRAKRLISKNFVEVIQDVCPDAMTQIEMIGGISGDDSETGE